MTAVEGYSRKDILVHCDRERDSHERDAEDMMISVPSRKVTAEGISQYRLCISGV